MARPSCRQATKCVRASQHDSVFACLCLVLFRMSRGYPVCAFQHDPAAHMQAWVPSIISFCTQHRGPSVPRTPGANQHVKSAYADDINNIQPPASEDPHVGAAGRPGSGTNPFIGAQSAPEIRTRAESTRDGEQHDPFPPNGNTCVCCSSC